MIVGSANGGGATCGSNAGGGIAWTDGGGGSDVAAGCAVTAGFAIAIRGAAVCTAFIFPVEAGRGGIGFGGTTTTGGSAGEGGASAKRFGGIELGTACARRPIPSGTFIPPSSGLDPSRGSPIRRRKA
jgi:hypothetical protein